MEEGIIQGFASIGGEQAWIKGFHRGQFRPSCPPVFLSFRWGIGKQQVEPDQDKTMVW